MEKKREISVSKVLEMLEDGISKEDINKFFELNPKEVKVLWGHPSLFNKRPSKYKVGIILVDDSVDEEGLPLPVPETFHNEGGSPFATDMDEEAH